MSTMGEIAAARRLTSNPGTCRALRIAGGVSLRELAAALHVDPSALSRWETGARRPRTDHALAWSRLLREIARGAS